MHGKNKDTSKDGTIRDGEYRNHKMHGLGKMISADGEV